MSETQNQFTCADCGFIWLKGQSGEHDCKSRILVRLGRVIRDRDSANLALASAVKERDAMKAALEIVDAIYSECLSEQDEETVRAALGNSDQPQPVAQEPISAQGGGQTCNPDEESSSLPKSDPLAVALPSVTETAKELELVDAKPIGPFMKRIERESILTRERATLVGEVKRLTEERAEVAEAWEQLACDFPAIQVDCDNTIQAAQFINSEWEKTQAELAQLRQDKVRLRDVVSMVREHQIMDSRTRTQKELHAAIDAAMQPSETDGKK